MGLNDKKHANPFLCNLSIMQPLISIFVFLLCSVCQQDLLKYLPILIAVLSLLLTEKHIFSEVGISANLMGKAAIFKQFRIIISTRIALLGWALDTPSSLLETTVYSNNLFLLFSGAALDFINSNIIEYKRQFYNIFVCTERVIPSSPCSRASIPS